MKQNSFSNSQFTMTTNPSKKNNSTITKLMTTKNFIISTTTSIQITTTTHTSTSTSLSSQISTTITSTTTTTTTLTTNEDKTPKIYRKIGCENLNLLINCSNNLVISIISATYYGTDKLKCKNLENDISRIDSECSLNKTSFVSNQCYNKKECKIEVNVVSLGIPCNLNPSLGIRKVSKNINNLEKYLIILYECIREKKIKTKFLSLN